MPMSAEVIASMGTVEDFEAAEKEDSCFFVNCSCHQSEQQSQGILIRQRNRVADYIVTATISLSAVFVAVSRLISMWILLLYDYYLPLLGFGYRYRFPGVYHIMDRTATQGPGRIQG
jgi:hypothetical protein